MDVDLRTNACSQKLGISTTTFQEIKYRLGYKGKRMTIEIFNEIEEIVEAIRDRYGNVTLTEISRYWFYVREEK